MIKLYEGNCLEQSDNIENGSIDLILTDLPYGNMDTDGGRKLGINGWDKALKPADIFRIANDKLRKNGRCVLFSQDPYTTELIKAAIPNLAFNYRATWVKDNFANALGVNKNMVSFTEDILIFTKLNPVHDSEFIHPLRPYFKEVLAYIGETKKSVISKIGQRVDHVIRFDSSQFALCTKEAYSALISEYFIDCMAGFQTYEALELVNAPFKSDLNNKADAINPAVFNLWEGNKYKANVLNYKKDYDGHHPTQKPVLLLEDLIKTFSLPNATVLDLTMGSGSTGVACVNTQRKFAGIELDPAYFKIAKARIYAE